ncbi:MAG TPA: hypothetical protein DHW12_00675, partial [Acinetobacter radioresistens]|nr:hypothetical protein [Acinetobacter radioresistens]
LFRSMPAWIQAIGSIVGILIAIWVPYKTNKNQIEEQRYRIELRRKNTLLLLLPTLYLIKRTIFEFLEENNPNAKDLFGEDIEEFNSNYFELIPHFSEKIQSLMDSDFKHDLLTKFCFELFKAEEHLNENSYLQRRGYHIAWLNHQDLFIEEAKNLHVLLKNLIENIEEMNSHPKLN